MIYWQGKKKPFSERYPVVRLSCSGPCSNLSLINEGSWTGVFLCLVISTPIGMPMANNRTPMSRRDPFGSVPGINKAIGLGLL